MSSPRFIHLHIHSEYSLRNGLAKIRLLVNKAAELKMPALALTDTSNLFGLIKFYKLARQAGIKPILGSDIKITNPFLEQEVCNLTVLALNNTGYKNLLKIISRSYQNGYEKEGPLIKREWLEKYAEGILLLSGGVKGDIGKGLIRRNHSFVKECVKFYKKNFPDRFYLELVRTGREKEEEYLQSALRLSIQNNIPVVAANEVCFLDPSDFEAHEIRVAIYHSLTLHDPKRPRQYSAQQYLRTEEEMCCLFDLMPQALENSVEIAKRCNVTLSIGSTYFLPQFTTHNSSIENYLVVQCQQGLEKRLQELFSDPLERNNKRPIYNDRLKMELKVINQMKFAGYFLIVMEFIQWAKNKGIPVGPGRGSGAGSLVAYTLNITDINPIAFDLLFERFLNPERISMPDLDIDFCMEKRDSVIEHVAEKYGRHCVSQIITFGTMAAKGVIRDVGRVLGHPYAFVDRIAKLIPVEPGITLEKSFSLEARLSEIYNTDKEVKILIELAHKLEGVMKNVSKHAGGVVIAPTRITDLTPIYCDENGQNQVTQYDKNDIEDIGLVKFDFLGLRTLTIINYTLNSIRARQKNLDELFIDLKSIPLNDPQTFVLLQQAETTAIFQLESPGMKKLIKRLKPDCFEDLIALVALFRPGPLQSGMVDNFINRKHGREPIAYPDHCWQHSSLKKILNPTYGIILYQEQVMKIAQVLAGYTLGESDLLRRAMSKKNPIEMSKQRSIFRTGASKKGIDDVLAMKIFDILEKFAGYGFNKSHSAAYALITYQTLWLKSHFPAEFMAAVMTSEIDNNEKVVRLVQECWRMGLKILPPNINQSQYHFYVNNQGEIIYGLGAIKGVGYGTIHALLHSRKIGGKFSDLYDLCTRTPNKDLNRRLLEKLILSGALDELGTHRAALHMNLNSVLTASNQLHKTSKSQKDMFSILGDKLVPENLSSNIMPWSEIQILSGERDTLGIYFSGHPLNPFLKEILFYTGGIRLKDIQSFKAGKPIKVAGIVIAFRTTITKAGTRIGICTLDDKSSTIEVLFFSKILDNYRQYIEKDRIIIVRGKINFTDFSIDQNISITAYEVKDIEEERIKYAKNLTILIKSEQCDQSILRQVRDTLEKHTSKVKKIIPVYIFYYSGDRSKVQPVKLVCGSAFKVCVSNHLLNELRSLLGSKHVFVEFNE
ncbi:MAG: DNA polymerase III subunit alpha [Candidatus Dasytiphilus stammeri]